MNRSLLEQFDEWIKPTQDKLKDEIRGVAKQLLVMGLDIFRGYVPMDTQQLKMNIKGMVHETAKGFEIRIYIENIDLSYEGKKRPINAIVLGMILENGKGRRGAMLKRSQNQEYASAGSPTRDWFEKAEALWQERASDLLGIWF